MPGVPYEQLWIHRLMLSDLVRGDAFRKALAEVIHPESVVLDIGAGSGILSLLAAQAGARKVYAVERTSIAELARKLIVTNGYADKVEVIQMDAADILLPEQVDVLVSEWLGPFGVDENFLPPVLAARDRWLKPNGFLLPESVTCWMAPIWDQNLDGELLFWETRPYGFDLSAIADHTADEIRYKQEHISPASLLADPQRLWTTDVQNCLAEDALGPFQAKVCFQFAGEVKINGFALWFTADFPGGTQLSCAPGKPETHWARTVCPLKKVLLVEPGAEIQVQFECLPKGIPGKTTSKWSVWQENRLWEEHDTRNALW